MKIYPSQRALEAAEKAERNWARARREWLVIGAVVLGASLWFNGYFKGVSDAKENQAAASKTLDATAQDDSDQ